MNCQRLGPIGLTVEAKRFQGRDEPDDAAKIIFGSICADLCESAGNLSEASPEALLLSAHESTENVYSYPQSYYQRYGICR